MATEQKLTIIRGDTTTYTVTLTDSAGDPIDITGYTFFMTVKKSKDDKDDDAIITEDVTSHSDPTNGVTVITLSSTDTNVAPGIYYYDIQYKDTSDNIKTVLYGVFEVLVDYTRRTS